LNTADLKEIEDLPMVGHKRAEDLIKARPLKSWDDVAKLPGFSPGMLDHLRSGGAELG
jgi:DNA uptake protein ComE-like DNA-binding protein